ncbi:CEP85 [Branchiostoma lanceolatum]|uniref:CEP85 protein n=1 Tax=Branchiostoma lanceolatum TaxID=7740 RepID=A0A8J9YPZ1_BRALA|nr:CEP85 [Branchiostoma lanceolatum]
MHSGNHGNLQQTNVPEYQTVHNDFVELPRSGAKDADVDWASPAVSTKPSTSRHRHPSSRTTRPATEDVPSHQTQASIPTAHVTPTTPAEPKHHSRESFHKRTNHVGSPEPDFTKHHGKVVAAVPENKHSKEDDKRVIDFDETCKDFKMPNLEHTMNMTSHFTVLPAEQTFNKSRFEQPPALSNHLPPGTTPNQSKHSSYTNQAVGYHGNHQHPMPAFPQQQRLYDPGSYSFPSANTSARTSYLSLPNALGGDRSPPNPEATSSYIPNSAPYHSSSNLQVPNLYVQPGGLQLSPESNISPVHPAGGFSQHGLPQENMTGVPGFKASDLTQWQQVQQLQLNQHLEHLEQQKRELLQQQQVYSSQSSPQYPSANNSLNNDPGRWDALVKVKDAILKEKDNIIYKQKQQLAQFQRQSREQDIRLRTTLRRTPGEEDVFNLKLQEYEYENASLKAQLAEATAAKDAEIEALNKKLGETEYEMQQLQEAVKHSSQEERQEVTKLQSKLKDRDKMVGDLKKKTKHAMEKYERYKKRVESLERYLGDLPTQEEAKKRADQLQTSKEEVSQLRERVVDLQDKLSLARKDNKLKDATVDSLEQKEQELVSMVTSLQKELGRWRDRGKQEERDAASQEDVEELKFENDRLREDCDRAKKLLESKHKKMKSLQSHHQTELEKLEERVVQEEGVVTALREEIRGKDEATRKLRESMKELASQNQDLLEQTLTLQEQLQELQRLNSAENTKLSQRLYRELGVCQSELQALVQVLMQRAEGKEPNMSILLGLKEPSTPPDDEQQGQNGHNLKTKLAQIRELRKEVDQLRSLISNKYAEDMGDNCIMQ